MAVSQEKVKINFCEYQEFLQLPGIGWAIADKIWEFRQKGINIDERTLATIPYVRTFHQLLGLIDFSPVQTPHLNFQFPEDSEPGLEYGDLDQTVRPKSSPSLVRESPKIENTSMGDYKKELNTESSKHNFAPKMSPIYKEIVPRSVFPTPTRTCYGADTPVQSRVKVPPYSLCTPSHFTPANRDAKPMPSYVNPTYDPRFVAHSLHLPSAYPAASVLTTTVNTTVRQLWHNKTVLR